MVEVVIMLVESPEKFYSRFENVKSSSSDEWYTPYHLYTYVLDYVMSYYNLPPDTPIVRPFYPGGDYKNFNYPPNCVVVDNPPFSISKEINMFYCENKIKFFLFANGKTLFSKSKPADITYIVTDSKMYMRRGDGTIGEILCGFVTNMDTCKIRIEPLLNTNLKFNIFCGQSLHEFSKISPTNYLTPAKCVKFARCGIGMSFGHDECELVNTEITLPNGDRIPKMFGGGLLIGNYKATLLHQLYAKHLQDLQYTLPDDYLKIVDSFDERFDLK